ncbi:roundabout homolog 3-like, partial [Pecten maximus]|uniref:roundabout homolog 3-like n=1 Tax=Pecten maximus TaxID=6579 RepID=UPI0014584C1A
MTPSGNKTFLTGTNVTLFCGVKGGNPLATLAWRCKGMQLTGIHWITNEEKRSKLSVSVDRSYHQKQCICTAEHQASQNRHFGTAAVLFDILYRPVITLDHSIAIVRKRNEFERTCSAQGNPTPITYWNHDGKSLTTAILKFPNIDRQDAGNYTCIAEATYGNVSLRSSKTLNIIVQYEPAVDVDIVNTTENRANLRLNCTANGEPTPYKYRWIHKIGSTVLRDSFDHVTNLGSVSTLTIPTVSLQDMGMYICEVENGIPGRAGQMVQTNQGFMSVTGRPRVISGQEKYVTEKDVSLDINVTFISFPEPVNTSILRTDSPLPLQSDPTVSVSPVPVSVSFYNKDVTVDGYMVQIHFSEFETEHRGHYQLYIRNVFAYYYNFTIDISDKPDPPTCMSIGQITENSATISWIPGEDNGHIQNFTLIHRYSSGGLQTNVTLNHTCTVFTVEDLAESTEYDVILYASNDKGTSETITGAFTTQSANISMESADIIGGAAGSAAAAIIIIIVVVLIRRRRHFPRRKPTEDKSADDMYGMRDNILYESAGPNWSPQPGPSNQELSGGAVYAAVRKPKLTINFKETQEYAEVDAPKKSVDESAGYEDVQKPGKRKTKTEPTKDMSADDNDGMKDNILYESAGP